MLAKIISPKEHSFVEVPERPREASRLFLSLSVFLSPSNIPVLESVSFKHGEGCAFGYSE